METKKANDISISAPPVSDGGQDLRRRANELPNGPLQNQKTDDNLVGLNEIFDLITSGLYNIASMLVGEGEESARLVEAVVSGDGISVCNDPADRKSGRKLLCAMALKSIEQRNPGSLAAPEQLAPTGICIEADHLEVARAAGDELARLSAGSGRERVREWLASLPTATRTVFVLCAVAGMTTENTARLLIEHGGPQAARWTSDTVHTIFLKGLCLLATQLIQDSTAQ
jgi:hypothetical protein